MARGGDSSRIVQFSRVITPVEEIQTWNATSHGFSFVISYQSRSGPVLDRKVSDKRTFPAIDISRSGTRKEELRPSKPVRLC